MKPSEEYTIRVLSPEDYAKLPYAGTKDSVGMSVMDTKTAYVKSTGVKDMDMATINHEFDELMQQQSPHEINGIRYKSGGKLGKVLGPVIGTIVGFATGNPAIGAAVGSAISGGTQAHSQRVKPEKYGSGFGGIAKSAALGGVGAYGGASLVNAGRVAATNAALSAQSAGGQFANTMGTFGAGVKGAGSLAASQAIPMAGATAVNMAVDSLKGTPQGRTQQQFPGFPGQQFAPQAPQVSPVTSAFAKQTQQPLGKTAFDKSLADLTANAAAQRSSVLEAFRGQRPRGAKGSSALARTLQESTTSSNLARQQFLEDQRKLGSTFA